MKALELADGLEKMTAVLYAHDAAAELRRLAEVNAELLEALESIYNRHNAETLALARQAMSKAKEQQ